MYKPKSHTSRYAHISSFEQYEELYKESIESPEQFWGKIAARLNWIKPWKEVSDYDFNNGNIKWFKDGKLNVSYNCIDRHINEGFGNDIAIIKTLTG